MKTPLQPIIALAELLRQGGINIEKDKAFLDIILEMQNDLSNLQKIY